MQDKLLAIERKFEILKLLTAKKTITRGELAVAFNVSAATISRDIIDLSKYIPLYTKQGNKGGIYIVPEYRSYKNYLSDKQEKCLLELIKVANRQQKVVLYEILAEFARNAK